MDKTQGLIDKANKVKPELDNTFKLLAAVHGLDPNKDFESRVKNPDTMNKKIELHKEAGKEGYGAKDINDTYGARFIADTPDQKEAIIKAVKQLGEDNQIKIDKTEQVHHDTYHAYHIDFSKDGVKGEIQIHDPHSLYESVTNHEIRAQYGEKPPAPLQQVKKANAQTGYALPGDQAQNVAQAVQLVRQMGVSNNGQ